MVDITKKPWDEISAEEQLYYEPFIKIGSDAATDDDLKLMQAAPEMYEALKIIGSGGEGHYRWSMTKAEALARDVISKLEVSPDVKKGDK